MANLEPGERPIQFSLVKGGPFHAFLLRLGLLGPDGLPTWRTALALALLAWMPPALVAVSQSLAQPDYAGWGFFKDGTVYTRYLVAIVTMVVTERFADGRISLLVNQFIQAQMLDAAAEAKFRAIVAAADRRAEKPLVEGMLLLLAVTWSWASFYFVSAVSRGGWEELNVAGATQLSWAGSTAELVSNPIFLFLVFRWLWRFCIWTGLLFGISQLPLRLTAMHPDRAGGLIFLAMFPGVFAGLVFALSCVVASSLVKSVALLDPSHLFIWVTIGGWILLMALIFLAPVFVFMPPLYRLREQALVEYGKLAQLHHQAFHENWITSEISGDKLLGSPDPSTGADLNACVQAVLDMRIVPLDHAAVLQLLAVAAIPFLAFLATQVPLAEILQWIVGAVL